MRQDKPEIDLGEGFTSISLVCSAIGAFRSAHRFVFVCGRGEVGQLFAPRMQDFPPSGIDRLGFQNFLCESPRTLTLIHYPYAHTECENEAWLSRSNFSLGSPSILSGDETRILEEVTEQRM